MAIRKSETSAETPFKTFDLSTAPGHLLRRCHQRSHELYMEVTGEFGLTRQQFAFLLALLQQPGANVQELADVTGTDRNTLGGMVSRLEAKGLIDRRRSDRDARAYELRISAAGVELLREMEPAIGTVGERILEPLTPEERVIFLGLARKLGGIV
ncbi:MAG: MarR family transcriptional regulator [Sphingomonadales bacterium]|nr:MAG: MarR family transcriptional regulator [Sphingomonadales bacterium]